MFYDWRCQNVQRRDRKCFFIFIEMIFARFFIHRKMEIVIGALASRLAVKHYKRTRNEFVSRFTPKMTFFDKFQSSIAKAVQLVSENHVFHEFPEASQLSQIDRLSIKLKDPQIHDMIQHWDGNHVSLSSFFLLAQV